EREGAAGPVKKGNFFMVEGRQVNPQKRTSSTLFCSRYTTHLYFSVISLFTPSVPAFRCLYNNDKLYSISSNFILSFFYYYMFISFYNRNVLIHQKLIFHLLGKFIKGRFFGSTLFHSSRCCYLSFFPLFINFHKFFSDLCLRASKLFSLF